MHYYLKTKLGYITCIRKGGKPLYRTTYWKKKATLFDLYDIIDIVRSMKKHGIANKLTIETR